MFELLIAVTLANADLAPQCQAEDDTTHAVCVWDGGTDGLGQHYLSLDHGKVKVFEDGSYRVNMNWRQV